MIFIYHVFPEFPLLKKLNGYVTTKTQLAKNPLVGEWANHAKKGDVFFNTMGYWEAVQPITAEKAADAVIKSYYNSFTLN